MSNEPEPSGLNEAEAVLRSLLVDLGVDEQEVEQASGDGTLHLLALERLVSLEPAVYTLEEVAAATGLDADAIRAYWRALGFPEPRPGEKLFSASDLEMLAAVLPFVAEGGLEPELAVQMARVIGSSLARIATAQIEAIERTISKHVDRLEGDDRSETGELHGASPEALNANDEDLVAAAQRAAELLPMMPKLMEFVWRRHLGHAARRRIMRATADQETEGVCVGFADLVGFTAQTQELPEDELAAVVDRFETIAYDQVAAHGGRVVKMIGDEVMFMADDVRTGARLALDLAAAYREDEALSDVRVGLASGRALERDGDVYGPVVNLASRIVAIAYPGSVVVSEDVYEALKDDEDVVFKSIRSHYLKDIGRVRLWSLRRAGDEHEPRYARARDRRAARRRFFLERRLLRQAAVAELAEGAVPGIGAAALLDDEQLVDPATGEFDALTDAVLDAEIDESIQVELLADIEAARRLHELEEEAQRLAEKVDEEAERRIDEIEEDARRRIEHIEKEKRLLVEAVLKEAEDKARRVNEEATRRVRKVAEEAERRAERAEKEAKREARRIAARRRAERERAARELKSNTPDENQGDG
ncbi:MAG: hypothetical protein N2037_02630 [Acidimicrobiales bacterium]|nr:hypothetical protein [Acidimicrobiales bacterium]